MAEKTKKSNEGEMFKLIAARYTFPDYVTISGVPDAAGFDKTRTADAISVATWPSRGLEIVGFEIKVSRADWQKELRVGAKAESICRRCDRWYVVVSDAAIVQPGELPETWGLLAAKGDRLVCVKEAPRLEAPRDVDRSFMVAMLRKAQEQSPILRDLKEAESAAYSRGHKDGKKSQDWERDHLAKKLEELQGAVTKFEEASGVHIYNAWTAGRIGEVVKLLAGNGYGTTIEQLKRVGETVKRASADIDQALACLEQPAKAS